MMDRYFPRKDTLRAKKKIRRQVNKIVRMLNRGMRNDVFKDRFSISIKDRQIRPYSDNSGWDANFLIEFCDKEQPERNYSYWFNIHSIVYSGMFAGGRHLDSDLNNFIVKSDFWEKYRNEQV